jgi:hypothetical protein
MLMQQIAYEEKVEEAVRDYRSKLRKLQKGGRNVFGTITGRHVVFVLDVSESMAPGLKELRAVMKDVIESQVRGVTRRRL